jgi:outer membrane phospholipase A
MASILADARRRGLALLWLLPLTGLSAEPAREEALPLSAFEPIYFAVGARGETTARFQISFKYRLFDRDQGWGTDLPFLTQLYFGYTQTTIWNLSDDSKPFHDTSYKPSFFWLWQDDGRRRFGVDGLRVGVEHESNGQSGLDSRSINIAFARPEWRWAIKEGRFFEFTPKFYGYLEKTENPDIQKYRGYVDWRVRYGGEERSWTAMARLGTAGKGSLTLEWFERVRGRGFGTGFLYAQFFAGYGEDILDYNQRYKSQIRFGYAIVR